MTAKITIFQDKSKKFRFNLKATNGEIIATSEAYSNKSAVLKGLASVQKNAATARVVDETLPKENAKKPAVKKAPARKAADSKVVKPAARKTARSPKARA
jgi:uncharacterized protein YegP (UPF0339 family)